MLTMTREQFEEMSFEELCSLAYQELDELTLEECLKIFAKNKIIDDNIMLAVHILNAIIDNPYDTEYYLYDYSMGMLETPKPVTCKEDFEDYIDFEDEE